MSDEVFKDDIIWHHGRQIEVKFWYDSSMGAPWKEHDCHGPVRDLKRKNQKSPGERIFGDLHAYDWQDAIKLAKKEGWYDCLDTFMHLTAQHRRVPTRGMIAEYAVQKDFDHLKGWCDNDWHWMGISVIDVETGVSDHCGGYSSEELDTDYIKERVEEMAERIYQETIEALLVA